MAKFTPGLMGAKTTPDLGGKSSIDGYDSSGDALLDSAIKGSIAQTNRNKAVKFQQAQVLRDGIVSGHFSDDMVTQVEGALDRMAKLNPNGKNYSKVLNEANAELGMTVQKQAQVTKLLERTSAAFEGDEDKKYYSKDAFFALLEDNTSLDLDSPGMNKAYQGYLKSTKNINEDVVREDFVELLGKYKFGGSTKSEEGNIGEFSTLKQGEYAGEKTQMYKMTKDGVSVPIYSDASKVPSDLVEKWGTSSKAHMAMMDNYVNNKLADKEFETTEAKDAAELLAGQEFVLDQIMAMMDNYVNNKLADKEFDTTEAKDAAELLAGKEFVLDQMKQVIPDYASISQKRESALPGQTDGSSKKANSSDLFLTTMARAITGDQSMIGDRTATEFKYQTGTISGFDITDQFKNVNLVKLTGGDGTPADKVISAPNENALYIDLRDGKGLKRYGQDEFNMLVQMAAEADNGFTMKDANTSQFYNVTRGAYEINQFYVDKEGKTKSRDEMTQKDFSSGNWQPANLSATGTDSRKFTPTKFNAAGIRSTQLAAAAVLNEIDGFSFENMASSTSSADTKKYAKALLPALLGKSFDDIGNGAPIKNIRNSYAPGDSDYVIQFSDGTEDVDVTAKDLAGIINGDKT